MPLVRFGGHVFPSILNITLSESMSVTWPYPEIGLHMAFTISVKESIVDVQCEVDHFEELELIEIAKRATHLARAAVNMVCFAGGLGATVVLEHVIRPNGIPDRIYSYDPALAQLCTAYGINTGNNAANTAFAQTYLMLVLDLSLARAIDDLVVANTVFDQSLVNCARAVETIRELLAPGLDRNDGWPLVHKALRCSKAYVVSITKPSTRVRHGDHSFIDGETTTQSIRRAWTLMDRYLILRNRGLQELPESEFPELT